MDPSVADPDPREARMLAAIVFTDVVGFSKLAAKNEARVYVALQRDMAVMTNLCRAHGGQVLNTMGDGMLLCFGSAVDALGCAVEIQRTLYNQSLALPGVDILRHRIGVHLGDVIMNGDNVFGDGVNVAARLQTLAQPGAVCYSDTVAAVVKNKLKVDANYLGPRQLKNIGEPVKVWQVPALGDHRVAAADTPPDGAISTPEHEIPGARGVKGGLMVLGSLLLLAILIFAFTRLKPMPRDPVSDKGGRHPLAETSGSTSGDTAGPEATSTATAGGTGSSGSTGGTGADEATQVQQTIRTFRAQYRFNDIVGLLIRKGDLARRDLEKIDTYRHLGSLETYVEAAAAAATPSNPIQVGRLDDLPEGEMPAQLYMQGQQLAVQTQDGQKLVSWDQLTARQYLEVATAAVNSPKPGTPPPPQAANYLQEFGTEFDVTPGS
jgi:class 3 adenylate cyclase